MKKRFFCAIIIVAGVLIYTGNYHKDSYNTAINYVSDGTRYIKQQVGYESNVLAPRVTLADGSSYLTPKVKITSPAIHNTSMGLRQSVGHTDQLQYKLRHDKECPMMRRFPVSHYGMRLQDAGGVSFFTKLNDDYSVLYCSVPKVASTNWKRMMIVLEMTEEERSSLTTEKLNNMRNVHNDPRVKPLSALGWKAHPNNQEYADYFKFTLFRHPFTRVVSAWRNKFHTEKVNKYFYKNYGIDIIRLTRGEAGVAKFYENNEENLVTFEEFITGIRNGIIDRHWSPQSEICSPCEVDYTYVGFFEYLTDDTNYIWKQIGVQEEMIRADHISEDGQVKSTTEYTRELFNQIPEREVEFMYKFYQKDFALFGYDRDVNSPTFPYPAIPRVT